MHYLGLITLYLALGFALLALLAGAGLFRLAPDLARKANSCSVLTTALSTLALVVSFLTDNFELAYVARNSARSLPVVYKISALWAGQSGSLLLWLVIISLFSLAVQGKRSFREKDFDLRVNTVINAVRVLFMILLLFVSSPFESLADPPINGQGLNPMLQSLGMVIHPPLLFLGFSGFLVPFAIMTAALWKREGGDDWLEEVKPWAVLAWLFLTAGTVTGGHWAYTELGWGGYWAWDPVENASLLPWLTGTALLHALHLGREQAGRKLWSYFLTVLTFALTIFGTFLTRSGVLDSVHAFSGGALGSIFLAVLAAILLFSLGLAWVRRDRLLDLETEEHSLLSLTFAIKAGSVLLLLLFAAVFFGTMFPLISRTLTGREIILDAGFFNQVTVPIFLVLFLLMGLAPVLPRKQAGTAALWRKIWLPLFVGLSVGLYTCFTKGGGAAALACAIAAFGLVAHVKSLAGGKERRLRLSSVLVHMGVLVMLIGVAGSSAYTDSVFVSVEPGEEIQFGPYVVSYMGLQARYGIDRYSVGTTLAVSREGRELGELTSEKTFWENRSQPSTEVGILSTVREDLYLNLAGWEGQTAQLHLQRFPLVSWIWFGSGIVYLGAALGLLAPKPATKADKQVKAWSRTF